MIKLKIGIDITPLKQGHQVRGVGTYIKNLVTYLKSNSEIDLREIEKANDSEDLDLIHYPYFSFISRLPVIENFDVPVVVTIHDVIPLVFPKQYPLGFRGKANLKFQKKILNKVDQIIVNSETTKQDVVRFLEVPADKVNVTYLGLNDKFRRINDAKKLRMIKNNYNLPERFLLYVGDINWNKNIINVIKSANETNVPLVICGKQALEIDNLDFSIRGPRDFLRKILGKTHPEQAHFKILSRMMEEKKVIRLGYVSDDDLVGIYNLASLLLFPSFYEGFGFPIIEAQACGTPVITSNISSMPEIAGKGAIFVDPYNIEDIKAKIKLVLAEKSLAKQLIEDGFENIKRFSWKKCAVDTIKVYEKSLNK